MKIIYSINEISEQVEALAKRKNEDYYVVEVRKTTCRVGQVEYVYRVYVNGFSWHKADNPASAILSLKKEMFPDEVKPGDQDVISEETK